MFLLYSVLMFFTSLALATAQPINLQDRLSNAQVELVAFGLRLGAPQTQEPLVDPTPQRPSSKGQPGKASTLLVHVSFTSIPMYPQCGLEITHLIIPINRLLAPGTSPAIILLDKF